jgi:type II secretory pathway predicted ATPase ExeA
MKELSATEKELMTAAAAIRDYQTKTERSDNQMCKDFAGLGSTRQFTRILSGDLEEVDAETNLANYKAVLNLITLLAENEADDDPLYDDLSTVDDLRKAVAIAMREKGLNRYVHMQGPQGSGKTTAARMLQARYGARVAFCEATEIWKDNMNAALGGILVALGVRQPPIAVAAKFTRLVEKLNESRLCLVIDEAQHLGPKTINLVKSLVNQTPGEFVLLAMGTLWNRLETQAYSEALQLTKNRLSERIRLDGVETADVKKIIQRRLGLDSEEAAKTLAASARQNGNLAFIKLVCRKARKLAGKGQVTPELLARATGVVAASR